ncbi:MAG: hypothetical protein EOL97_14815 [Spirochaetia bacterium]|nr:hypothetical protein [Spirochaetia bacterium]
MISIIFLNSAFSRDLSIDDAVNQALNKSSSILQKTLDLKSSQIDDDGKYSSFYPSIQATTVLQRSNQGCQPQAILSFIENKNFSNSRVNFKTILSNSN